MRRLPLLLAAWLGACATAHETRRTDVRPQPIQMMPDPSYERAIAWRVPEGLTFELAGPPTLEADQFVFRGVLRNASDRDAAVIVLPSGSGGAFHAELKTGAEVDFWRPDDPERPNLPPRPMPAPPPPMEFVLPAHSEAEFRAPIELVFYKYRGEPEVEASWTFLYWNEPKPRGSVRVRLPRR